MNVATRNILAPILIAVGLIGCTAEYDVGSSPQEQLCDVLKQPSVEVGSVPDGFAYKPLLEGAATDPADLPLELQIVAITYQTKRDAYDQLGPYEPAIQFAEHLWELSTEGLIGPSTLSPKVLESALAIDKALQTEGCSQYD